MIETEKSISILLSFIENLYQDKMKNITEFKKALKESTFAGEGLGKLMIKMSLNINEVQIEVIERIRKKIEELGLI